MNAPQIHVLKFNYDITSHKMQNEMRAILHSAHFEAGIEIWQREPTEISHDLKLVMTKYVMILCIEQVGERSKLCISKSFSYLLIGRCLQL